MDLTLSIHNVHCLTILGHSWIYRTRSFSLLLLLPDKNLSLLDATSSIDIAQHGSQAAYHAR
jgi:hypothetical protein